MKDIEFIRWLCEYAEGFEIYIMGIKDIEEWEGIDIEKLSSFGMGCVLGRGDLKGFEEWNKIYYPLFLQRAIEGINYYLKYTIFQNKSMISVHYDDKKFSEIFYFKDYNSIDEVKEKALYYIYEQIRENNG